MASQIASETSVGIVKWFDNKKGYGFIQCGDLDIFVHHTAIQSDTFKTLNTDEQVQVTYEDTPKGLRATEVIRNI